MGKKLTIEDAHKIARQRGGECLSTEYENSLGYLIWSCKKKHIWQATYNNASQGKWCPTCAGRKRLTIEDAHNIAKQRGGKCLSLTMENSSEKLSWECKVRHIWKATLNHIKNDNSWCPRCVGKEKLSLEEIVDKLSQNGFDLQEIIKDGDKKLARVKCKKCFYVWSPHYKNILYGSGCPSCSGKVKYTIEHVRSIVEQKGGLLLSKTYKNIDGKLEVKCLDCDLIWSPSFRNIKKNTWCPNCADTMVGKEQEKIVEILKNYFAGESVVSNYKGFDWLVMSDSKRRQEIDIWVPHIKLAIEYDGMQHFIPIKKWGGEERFKRQKLLDKNKNKLIKQHSNEIKYFVRFSYKDIINEQNVIKKLNKLLKPADARVKGKNKGANNG